MQTSNYHPNTVKKVLFLLFAMPGLGFASWVSRTPAVRDLLHVSTAEMGVIIFALAGGSLLGLLTTGSIIACKGARPVIVGSSLLIVTGFLIIGVGTLLKSVAVVMAGLAIFGCGYDRLR